MKTQKLNQPTHSRSIKPGGHNKNPEDMEIKFTPPTDTVLTLVDPIKKIYKYLPTSKSQINEQP